MRIENGINLISRARYLVPGLFLALALIQILDVHSTLSASPGHFEANKVINLFAGLFGFTAGVLIMKACSAFVLLVLYRVWSASNGTHNREFVICLTLIAVVYGVIVANNYLS